MLAEDKDYLLYRVVVLSKMVDTFKTTAREKGFQVRDFTLRAGPLQAETPGSTVTDNTWVTDNAEEVTYRPVANSVQLDEESACGLPADGV